MLYMVECGFADPLRERSWNDWYSGPKLASLLALPGWIGSQRFKAVGDVPAPWLAVHAVPGPEFFTSAAYKNAGGGNFADWGPLITNWSRNLFDGHDGGFPVPNDRLLAIADVAPGADPLPGVRFAWVRGVGLDRTVANRAVAVVPASKAGQGTGVRFYQPFTSWMPGLG